MDAPSAMDAAIDAPPVDAAPIDANLPEGTCAAVRVSTSHTTPNVIVVIDESGSMSMLFDAAGSRWGVLRDSLIGMPSGLVYTLQHEVRFGAVMYTDDPDVAGCPDTTSTPAVIDGFTPIGALYSTAAPSGNTPTGDTIDRIITNIATLAPMRGPDPTILVLATDGEPGSCADSADVTAGRAYVIDRVTTAHAMGIDTYVISVGVGIAVTHLQEVANAGLGRGSGDPDAPFWVATDTLGLHDALQTIVGGVLSCNLVLAGTIYPALACEGTVTLGADTLACGTDWRAVDATHIEILGPACDRLLHTTDELVATFPCDVLH